MHKEKRLQNIRALKQITAAVLQDRFILDFPFCIAEKVSGPEARVEEHKTNKQIIPARKC